MSMIDVTALQAARKARGLSQAKLGKIAGVSPQLIGEIERGAVQTTKKIFAIAQALEVPPSVLDPGIPAIVSLESELRGLDPDELADVLTALQNTLRIVRKRKHPHKLGG